MVESQYPLKTVLFTFSIRIQVKSSNLTRKPMQTMFYRLTAVRTSSYRRVLEKTAAPSFGSAQKRKQMLTASLNRQIIQLVTI